MRLECHHASIRRAQRGVLGRRVDVESTSCGRTSFVDQHLRLLVLRLRVRCRTQRVPRPHTDTRHDESTANRPRQPPTLLDATGRGHTPTQPLDDAGLHIRERKVVPHRREPGLDLHLAQRDLQRGRVRKPVPRGLLQASQNRLLQERGYLGEGAGRQRLLAEVGEEDFGGIVGLEGATPGDQLEQGATHRVNVAALVATEARDQLGGEIAGGPGPRLRAALFSPDLRDAEVEQLHRVAPPLDLFERDVLGLDVAVHDPGLVGDGETLADLANDRNDALERQRPPVANDTTQRLSLEQLHGDRQPTVGEFEEVVDVDDEP